MFTIRTRSTVLDNHQIFGTYMYQCQGQGVNLKTYSYKAIAASNKSTLIEFFFDICMKKIAVKA